MSNGRSTSPISVPAPAHQRRASLASGLSFSDYYSRPGGNSATQPSSVTSAAANAQSNQRRRLSITTLGLSGSPTQTSPFGGRTLHRGSVSSSVGSTPATIEDSVVEDPDGAPSNATPNTPFARRMSFGAQALRDARSGSLSNGRYPPPGSSSGMGGRRTSSSVGPSTHSPTKSTSASTNTVFPQNERSNVSWRQLGEGFNWSEALRSRAERAPSLGSVSPNTPQSQNAAGASQQSYHQRAASIASMEQPTREMPKQPKQNKPDFFQEKILRGDFMD
ncbi:hypothetical protein ASPWEDRAFT_26249 [Aspergillus wentii DTO 134E9]|uniref:Uncharacterized protein n=1 Tax=Aspergillus wentii DTO 134E9 TaxID=1073089 RepID=A0A1L9RPQ3_ASPWE|nr:uncharacterized protein ASPWEDRAFT_26249 [Aspergillus wentii DTO 134E9]KAI9924155.1 hypothetical protein MW887_007395 [Aspergillus wentii]OJJ36797.1 hypothetical protein ASPWEDRAFT_26249 [Aspergillus wentii DTO 134E9]